MHDEVRTKEQICEPDQQLPDQPASPMSVKGEDYVDYTCQNDEPSNDHVDGNGREMANRPPKFQKQSARHPKGLITSKRAARSRPDCALPWKPPQGGRTKPIPKDNSRKPLRSTS